MPSVRQNIEHEVDEGARVVCVVLQQIEGRHILSVERDDFPVENTRCTPDRGEGQGLGG